MFHRLHGVSPQCYDAKQGGEGGSQVTKNGHLKAAFKPVIMQQPKGKEKLFSEDLIIDNDEDEEPDEAEFRRRKAREAELDENSSIVREAEEKERDEKEAQTTLNSKMLLFPKWTLK
ncbi:unnamed protein product [Lactuca saligna]|uniref:Uncharacterized protein n=1 Tax=Lactuca saligna TaxID=75948 RepID=A0AA35V987_LACSI|nr:unnamed protein product [Lactuca saligna]